MDGKISKKLSENILDKISMDFLRNQVLKNAYGNNDTVIAAMDPRILIAWYLFFGIVPWFVSDIPFLMGSFLLVMATTLLAHVAGLVLFLFGLGVFSQTGYLFLVTLLFGGDASAIAPLLVLWMGFEMAPKVTLVALTTFFPIAVSLLEGYASTDKAAASLLRSMGASRWQIFRHLEFPSALSHFFSGLRVSVSYAVVGAVISEWLGGTEGLGVYMTRVKKAYAFDKMFAVIIVIVAVSLLLMGLVTLLRRAAMPWETYEKIERND